WAGGYRLNGKHGVHAQNWLSPRALMLNGILGLLGLILIGGGILGFTSFESILFPGYFRHMLANIFFLNTIHVVFTIILLRTSSEYSKRLKFVNGKFKWFSAFLFLLSTSILAIFITESEFSLSAKAAAVFVVLIPQFHVLA